MLRLSVVMNSILSKVVELVTPRMTGTYVTRFLFLADLELGQSM